MKDVMIDLETLGVGDNAVVTSIGACFFDRFTGEIGDMFHEHIKIQDSLNHGREIDPDTLMWWMDQGINARGALIVGQKVDTALNVAHAVVNFEHWFKMDRNGWRGGYEDICVWGNGISFDLAKLRHMSGGDEPWSFWCERDVRTIVDVGQALGVDPKSKHNFEGIPHCALDDAINQAQYVSAIFAAIKDAGELV